MDRVYSTPQSPFELVRKNIFTINDVDLIIPPTSIAVQKEDLVYKWKTLRTRTSTKIPSGNGQIAVTVSCIFKKEQLLDLHRLLVEFRNSPFVYIENKYLRETICPQWAITQNMAFIVNGVDVAPVGGAPDCLSMQLALTWFNYFPYGNNFLFRDDYVTNWLNSPNSKGNQAMLSIGWTWEDGKQKHRPSVIHSRDSSEAVSSRHNLLSGEDEKQKNLTIQELEKLHMGEEWDLLPLPGNMVPAKIVTRPIESNIYVRYINLLQRDALLENFGFDIEEKLKSISENAFDAFFTAVDRGQSSALKRTYPLNDGRAIDEKYVEARIAWNTVSAEAISQMLRYDSKLSFSFQTYCSLDIPSWMTDRSDKIKNSIIAEIMRERGQSLTEGGYEYLVKTQDGIAEPIRRGFANPDGIYPVVGQNGTPFTWEEMTKITGGSGSLGRVNIRPASFNKQAYGESGTSFPAKDRVHYGTDFGGKEGLDVYAIRPGIVYAVSDTDTSAGLSWFVYDALTNKSSRLNASRFDDWTESVQKHLGVPAGQAASIKSINTFDTPLGTVVPSNNAASSFYYVGFREGGRYIYIRHDTPSGVSDVSAYMHLGSIEPGITLGSKVEGGQKIATVGSSSLFSNEYIREKVKSFSSPNAYVGSAIGPVASSMRSALSEKSTAETLKTVSSTIQTDASGETSGNVFAVPSHLHFEYWEDVNYGQPPNMATGLLNVRHPRKSVAADGSRICVDPIPSIEQALNRFTNDALRTDQEAITLDQKEMVEQNIKELEKSGKLDDQQKAELTAMQTIFLQMIDDGWTYFDASSSIANVWTKVFNLDILRGEDLGKHTVDSIGQMFVEDPAVFTGFSGGFRNIVSTVPILGQEYPTAQFLGSNEPLYSFEITMLDQKDLDSVPEAGALLEGMRSILQHNARKFREVEDSWCVATDSFITRLFGSYRNNDNERIIDTNVEAGGAITERVAEYQLHKRTVITRADNGTVEGFPGLSYMNMVLEETNPYTDVKIVGTVQKLDDAEAARKEVLQAVVNFDFAGSGLDAQKVLTSIILNDVGGDILDPSSNSFGIIKASTQGEILNATGTGTGNFIVEDGNFDFAESGLLVRSDQDMQDVLDAAGIEYREVPGTSQLWVPPTQAPDWFDPEKTQVINTAQTVTLNNNYGEAADGGKGSVQREVEIKSKFIDLSNLLSSELYSDLYNQEYGEVLDYYRTIKSIIRTVNRVIAEPVDELTSGGYYNNGKGLLPGVAKEGLYDIPGIVPSMWRSWQVFMKEHLTQTVSTTGIGQLMPYGGQFGTTPLAVRQKAILQMEGNINWLSFTANLKDIDEETYQEIRDIEFDAYGSATWFAAPAGFAFDAFAEGLYDAGTAFSNNATVAFQVASDSAMAGGLLAYSAANYASSFDPTGVYTSLLGTDNETRAASAGGLASGAYKLLTADKFRATSSIEVGNYTFEENTSSNLTRMTELYMRSLPMTQVWFADLVKSYVDESVIGSLLGTLLNGFEGGEGTKANPLASTHNALYHCLESSGYWGYNMQGVPSFMLMDKIAEEQAGDRRTAQPENDTFDTVQTAHGKFPVNSPFVWKVVEVEEKAKVSYFKGVLAAIADDIRRNPKALEALGLQELGLFSASERIVGNEAYPDITLPFHPFYGDKKSMGPDFYMWNIYEDGQAFHGDVLEELTKTTDSIVDRSYRSMVEMQTGKKYDPSTDPLVNESTSTPLETRTTFAAEGTDANHHRPVTDSEQDNNARPGPMSSPFYPNDQAKEYEQFFESAVSDSAVKDDTKKFFAGEFKNKPPMPSLDPTEGPVGQGGGIQYPKRLDDANYNKLRDAVNSTEKMFGTSTGSLDSQHSEDILKSLKGTNADYIDEFGHFFDPASLKSLARESARDMLSQKLTMRRAYPTFKLFFVEEDEMENRIIAFDDFHSYNGVVDFTVVQNRKNPADHAMITLQNVGGSLDGTRKNAVADADYITGYNSSLKSSDKTEDNATNRNTSSEQAFSAVVLRPGLNVQLRAGYSNDPDNLHVLINGRIVDISWNDNGDLAKIMVQSFGTELAAITKNFNETESSKTEFATTHHLLSHLMLSPEVAHFGRWEIGKLFQEGESKDARLDFTDYSREGYMGRFSDASGVVRWLFNHPKTMFAAAGLGVALNFLPQTKALTGFTAPVGRLTFFGRYFSSGAVKSAANLAATGTRGTTTAFGSNVSKVLLRNVDDVATSSNVSALADDVLEVFARNADDYIDDVAKVASEAGATTAQINRFRDNAAYAVLEADDVVDDIVLALTSSSRELSREVAKGQWLPIARESGQGILSYMGAIGKEVATNRKMQMLGLAGSFSANLSRLVVDAAVVGAVVSGLRLLLQPVYDATVGQVKEFYTRSLVSMMLSPQDDNLYPPHPKDYMVLREHNFIAEATRYLLWTAGTALTLDQELALQGTRYVMGEDIFLDKRAPVEAYNYTIKGSTIWDIFHEMSLRHPGWIYGARPYGNSFRYTMFFGIPSQRYWAKPATPAFVNRANELKRYLDDGKITETEYLGLYGDSIGEEGETLEDRRNFYRENFIGMSGLDFSAAAKDDAEEFVKEAMAHDMNGRAMKEYLQALNHRFVPFRRYHMLSSDNDIVWNGLMSSENAMTNAVDVTYAQTAAESTQAYGNVVFKAHWSIPPHLIRTTVMPPYPNCKGYNMAMRYGMGGLMYQMRDMYRGEIITIGNPRIRPWDICILQDTYNDMVGPVEVEQVVHSFSYNTGFITEIKPSAVVIGNEISSYPVLTAMKIFSLAVRDIEKTNDLSLNGLSAIPTSVINLRGTEDLQTLATQRYEEYFGGQNPLGAAFPDGNIPDTSKLEDELSAVQTVVENVGTGVALLGAAGALTAGVVGAKTIGVAGKIAGTTASGAAAVPFGIGALGVGASLAVGGGINGIVRSATPSASLAFLMGGPILFAQCLRDDAVILMPLVKNGKPIVSGFNYHDPSLVWQSVGGVLKRYAEDVFVGGENLVTLYTKYGNHAWSKMSEVWNSDSVNMIGD